MLFSKKKKIPRDNPLQDTIAGKIAGGFIKAQTLFSTGMSRLFLNMHPKKLKILFISFCLLSGGFSIYLLVDAVISTPTPAMKIDHVRVPKHFNQPGDDIIENVLPPEIYLQVQQYRKYMDSLGLPIRQSLLDSITVLEQIYHSQQK